MSDFSSLLKQLDKSAKRLAVEEPSDNINKSSEKKGRKRPRIEGPPSQVSEQGSELPRDHGDLSIQLSFLCIGAQKAGTTWMHEMLAKIPGLGLPSQKELHFWDWYRRKGLAWYSQQFPSGCGLKYGETTPDYSVLSDRDIREIQQLFPSVRIIFLARDLVERAWSAIAMELRNNARGLGPGEWSSKDEESTMDAQTLNRINREADPANQPDSYFMDRLKNETHTDRSDYASGLRRWLAHFPKEQLLILDYRLLASDPEQLMSHVLNHIGISHVDKEVNAMKYELQRRVNAAPGPSTTQPSIRPNLRHEMERYLRPYAQDFNTLLKELGYDWSLDEYERHDIA
jgi:hypothetical protein